MPVYDGIPPQLTEKQFEALRAQIADYQLTHGSLLTMPFLSTKLDSCVPLSRPIGVTMFPTPFPRRLFLQALELQPLMNVLYARVAEDAEWLASVLVGLRQHDDFTAKLWSVWERISGEGEVQPLRCGIWRSDYMLHSEPLSPADTAGAQGGIGEEAGKDNRPLAGSQLKQVEFNTYSCAGGSHGNIVAHMHRYLACRGTQVTQFISPGTTPENNTIESIVATLEAAHRLYGPAVSQARQTAVLMTVQPRNVNICDERPIEYGLSHRAIPVPLFRAAFSEDVMRSCSLGPHRELLFHPPLLHEPVEISVVYHRAGYDEEEYDEQGVDARLLLERSRAIKCPTVLSHIAGLKKVQQALAEPGALERFVDVHEAEQLRITFMPMHPMDSSEEGQVARDLVKDEKACDNFILKPPLEGGGHNVYGADIPHHLRRLPEAKWGNYILMEKIRSPPLANVLLSHLSTYEGPVISELGVFGGCIWRRGGQEGTAEMLRNEGADWSFKTKPSHENEMSVVKGYGFFDTPLLVDKCNA